MRKLQLKHKLCLYYIISTPNVEILSLVGLSGEIEVYEPSYERFGNEFFPNLIQIYFAEMKFNRIPTVLGLK